MKTKYLFDKEERLKLWGPGPWIDEPDYVEWQHEEVGYPCLLLRAPEIATWCGYAGVPKDHPLHGLPYDTVQYATEVHHGLSFAGEPGDHGEEFEGYWYFGFDAAHYMDVMPFLARRLKQQGTYKDFRYMRSQAEELAKALWELRDTPAPGFRITYTNEGFDG